MPKTNFRKKVENALIRAGHSDLAMHEYVYCDRNKLSSKVKYCFTRVDKAARALIKYAIEKEFPGRTVDIIQTAENRNYYGYHWGLSIRVHHKPNEKLGEDEDVVDMKSLLKSTWTIEHNKKVAAEGRGELIRQLRFALGEAESPRNDVVEFEIGDEDFSFDFSV